jgi:processive 1,2-diacylglycerol beta-glucosyltransferase
VKKILSLSISKHTGHFRAAKSIEDAISLIDPTAEVLSIDAMQFFHPVSSRIVDKVYFSSLEKAPFLWGAIYDKKDAETAVKPIQHMLNKSNFKKLDRLIKSYRPQAIVCTQAFPCGLVAYYKRKTGSPIPLIATVTDFWPHRFWFYPEVDRYTIASDWAKARFRDFGVPADRVTVTGIPIHPHFSDVLDVATTQKSLGLEPGVLTVLVMGGSSGLGPIAETVRVLDDSSVKAQFVVICGKNERLYEQLNMQEFRSRVKVVGFTDEVYKYMTAADIVISKPGGITTAEVLAKEKMMIAVPSIPGQEYFNLRYLLRNGMAVRAKRLAMIPAQLKRLAETRTLQQRMRKAVAKIARPCASLDIARLALESCIDRVQL